MSTYRPSNIKTPPTVHHLCPAGLLCTFCERRGLGCVRQAELALLPAAVVADQRVVGLLDVHIIANTEHVTGSLDVQTTGENSHCLQIPITPPQELQRIWNMISCTLSRTAVSSSRWCLDKHLENYTFTTEGCLESEKVFLFYLCCCGCTETGNHIKWCQRFPNAWQYSTFYLKVKPNQTQHLGRCRSYLSWLSLCTQDKYLEV